MSTYKIIVLTWVAATGLCLAQNSGNIRGTVTDPAGASVPGADVSATNIQTGLTQNTKSSNDGVYSIPFLPVGNYNVTIEQTGFRKSEIANVRVDVNSDVPVNVQLLIGTLGQSVEVSAAAPLLEVTGQNLGKTLPAQAIEDLPLSISGSIRKAGQGAAPQTAAAQAGGHVQPQGDPLTVTPLTPERSEPIAYMVDHIRHKQALDGPSALDLNVRVQEVLEAAKLSIKTGKVVPLPLESHYGASN